MDVIFLNYWSNWSTLETLRIIQWSLKMIGCLEGWWCMCFQHRKYLLSRLLPFKGWTAVNWRSHFVGIWKNKMLGKLFFYTENLCRGSEGWPCLGSVIDGKRKAEITWVSKNFQAVKRIARLEGFWFISLVLPFGFLFLGLCVLGIFLLLLFW